MQLRKKDEGGGLFSFLNQNQDNFSDEEEKPAKSKDRKKPEKQKSQTKMKSRDDDQTTKLFGEFKTHVAETCGTAFGNISKQMSPLEITLQDRIPTVKLKIRYPDFPMLFQEFSISPSGS